MSRKFVVVTAGCYLRGSLTLIKDNAAASIPAEYVLSDTCTLSGDSNKDKSANEDKDKMTEYKEAQLRLSSQWISKFKIAEALELYKKLVEDNGYTSLAPHLAILNSLAKEIESGLEKVKAGAEAPPTTADAAPTGDQLQGHIHEFFKITNSIIHCDDNVNKAELLTFMGVKNDDSDNSAARKSEMNKRKKDLVEAYSVHLATMSLLIYTPNSLDLADLVSLPILQKDFKELLKFTDASDKSISKTYIKYLRANGCVAMAISQINKSLDGSKSKEIENLLVQLYGELGWTHVESHLKDWMLLKFPPSYTLF
ncbi:TPP2 [Bugula neritina]|uniref:TPP2 n=1 Tax=Bugula neritina TaxID=10212 RepID=A0A7J7JY46_BUGNE|nr:TPP2 [Bugula neritina]